jgi:hypothetical protein
MPPDLADLIASLEPSVSVEGVFAVSEIPGFEGHYVGRDDRTRACVLLGAVDSNYRAPIRLNGLDVQYAIDCAVQLPGSPEIRQSLTVVRCTEASDQAERYFLHVMASLVQLVGVRPRLQKIAEAIMRVASIFQRLSGRGKESVTGLIGELLLISKASDPAAAIAAWRQDVDERYDFAAGNLRLEVKTSMSRRRVHGFSYEQCDVPARCFGVLASVFVERSAGGMSLEQLLMQIVNQLRGDAAAIFRLEQTTAETLGADLMQALSFSFDAEGAYASIAFFDLRDIPAVREALPPGVSSVRFISDVSGQPPIDRKSLRDACPEFSAFVPVLN